jgi:Tfp pilus assembly PilM family ATPase
VCRELAGSVPTDAAELDRYVANLVRLATETAVFFRGRHRHEIGRVHLAGGGALHAGVFERLQRALPLDVRAFDPVSRFLPDIREGTRLVGAYGLSRAGGEHV